MTESYYNSLQGSPELGIDTVRGSRRKRKNIPIWKQKIDWEKQYRQEIGEEKYDRLVKAEEERNKRYQNED